MRGFPFGTLGWNFTPYQRPDVWEQPDPFTPSNSLTLWSGPCMRTVIRRRDEGWQGRLCFSGRRKRWIYFCLQSKKATHLTSMLCLSGASADVSGCLNALCKLKVQGTSASLPLVVEPTALD